MDTKSKPETIEGQSAEAVALPPSCSAAFDVLTAIAGVASIVAFVMVIAREWQAASLAWTVVATCLWFRPRCCPPNKLLTETHEIHR